MRLEFKQFSDGESELTVVFESRQDMDKFTTVHGKFHALLPDKPSPDKYAPTAGDVL